MSDAEFEDWLATRPECVQKLAREFPPMSRIEVIGGPYDGGIFYLIGWTEDDKLIVSNINPREDYEGARASRWRLCAEHVRQKRHDG